MYPSVFWAYRGEHPLLTPPSWSLSQMIHVTWVSVLYFTRGVQYLHGKVKRPHLQSTYYVPRTLPTWFLSLQNNSLEMGIIQSRTGKQRLWKCPHRPLVPQMLKPNTCVLFCLTALNWSHELYLLHLLVSFFCLPLPDLYTISTSVKCSECHQGHMWELTVGWIFLTVASYYQYI